MPAPKKKVTLYFSESMLLETQKEAVRQDRSVSWIIQAAWRIARLDMQKMPSVEQRLAILAGGDPTLARRDGDQHVASPALPVVRSSLSS